MASAVIRCASGGAGSDRRAIVMALTYACLLYLRPAGERALRDKLLDIRADMAGALLNEGDFNTPSKGLTSSSAGSAIVARSRRSGA